MEDKRLTEKERLFAEKWHGLIYSFLHENNLTENEYYDVAALGYLRAVTRYSREPKLREYSFSTIAWQAMRSAVGNKKKSDKIRNAFIAYSLNELTDEGTEYGEFIEASRDGFKELAYTEDMQDLMMAIMPNISEKQRTHLVSQLQGFKAREIMKEQHISVQEYHQNNREIRAAVSQVLGTIAIGGGVLRRVLMLLGAMHYEK